MSGVESKTEVFTISGPEMAEPPAGRDQTKNEKSRTVFERYVQPCFAELFGTTLFVFVGCASVVGNVPVGVIQPAVAHGLALGVLIMLCGGMELLLLVPYVVAQMCGGMMGAGLVKVVYPPSMYGLGGAFNAVATSNDLGEATLAEAVMTMFLTTAVCMGAVNSQTSTQLAPFCIGLTVTANILAGGVLSGACMNPARAFGPAVVANYWIHHWVYWVGPICGALLTVVTVRLLFGDRKTRLLLK